MVDDKTIQHDVEVEVSWGDGQAWVTRMKINADVEAMETWTRHKDALKVLKAHFKQYAQEASTGNVICQDAPKSGESQATYY